ncbi:hypothetical protein Tco_0209509 [Tanacetum coccineum]
MLLAGSELTKEDKESQLYDEFERFKMLPRENINEYYVRFHKLVNDMGNISMTMPNIQLNSKFVNNMSPEWDRELVQRVIGEHRIELGMPMQDNMLLIQAQENGAVLDEEELLFLAGEQTNAFDADVDDQPVRDLTENDDNIFQADECDAFESNDGHETHNEVQQKHVIDSNGVDMGNSNVIPYEQYLTTNEVSVEPSCASSVPNDAYVLHDNNAYIHHDPLVTELNIYKQQVAMYKQHAKFDLKLREQKMDEQMSILIQDRNKKEENLKKELHSVKLQLNSTIKSNKIIEETITSLKLEFK